MGTSRCIDWGVLADCGEAGRDRAILAEDTPYRAHQAAVRAEDDAELPLDIEFSLGGQHFEMSIEWFAVHLGVYYEPETVLDDFAHGLTQGEDGVMRAWWAQISDTSFTGHRERGTLWGDAFITHIARTRGMVDMLDDLPAIEPRKLDRRTIISMKLVADIPDLGLRFIGQDGRPFQPAQVVVAVPDQQQQDGGPIPEPEPIQEEPVQSPPREEEPPQHPPHVYRAVRLTEPLEALHHIAARCDETAQQMAESDRRRAA
ncbi:hypothetical protein R6Q57_016201 [Mikania cordata]